MTIHQQKIAAAEVGLKGLFKMVATNAKGERRVVADWFDNLILNAGLDRLGSTTEGVIAGVHVGTGNTPPAVGQTALVNPVAYSGDQPSGARVRGFDSVSNQYVFGRSTYRFAAGTAAGNLAEVGAGWPSGLFSRALIKDGNGDPITVTVLPDETLDVIYELRVYIPSADVTTTVNISGTDYAVVIRARDINDNASNGLWNPFMLWDTGSGVNTSTSISTYAQGPGALGDVLSAPAGTYVGTGTGAFLGSYVPGSFERTYRTTWGLEQGDGPIGAITMGARTGAFKASFTPSIPKDNTKILTIDWKVSFTRRP